MDLNKRVEREKRKCLYKIFIPMTIMAFAGYFLYTLIAGNFFVGWEIYFAEGCYVSILMVLLVADVGIVQWMHYDIHIEDRKLKIRDGFFIRVITIPLERIYYVSSIRSRGSIDYDSLFITDKKIKHKKIRQLTEEDFKNSKEHFDVIQELKDTYPEHIFYYYRVQHHGYKFLYFFHLLYKNCESCKFSDTSMELVKRYVEQK